MGPAICVPKTQAFGTERGGGKGVQIFFHEISGNPEQPLGWGVCGRQPWASSPLALKCLQKETRTRMIILKEKTSINAPMMPTLSLLLLETLQYRLRSGWIYLRDFVANGISNLGR